MKLQFAKHWQTWQIVEKKLNAKKWPMACFTQQQVYGKFLQITNYLNINLVPYRPYLILATLHKIHDQRSWLRQNLHWKIWKFWWWFSRTWKLLYRRRVTWWGIQPVRLFILKSHWLFDWKLLFLGLQIVWYLTLNGWKMQLDRICVMLWRQFPIVKQLIRNAKMNTLD